MYYNSARPVTSPDEKGGGLSAGLAPSLVKTEQNVQRTLAWKKKGRHQEDL